MAWVPPTLPDLPEIRRDWANWYSSLRYLDEQFGRLIKAIDELGVRDDTLVVYTTDHGTGGMRGKGQLYEQGAEIALLVRPPKGYRTGYRVQHLIPNIDYMPTWLEACGIAVPEDINGRSFWPLIAGGQYTPHEHVFIERNFHGEWREPRASTYVDKYDPQRAVMTQDFQYIRNMRPAARARCWYRHEITGYDEVPGKTEGVLLPLPREERPAEELYDRRHDPWNQQDVAGRPEYAEVQRDLRGKLAAWMHATNDPALRPEMPQPLDQPVHWPTRDRVCDVARC